MNSGHFWGFPAQPHINTFSVPLTPLNAPVFLSLPSKRVNTVYGVVRGPPWPNNPLLSARWHGVHTRSACSRSTGATTLADAAHRGGPLYAVHTLSHTLPTHRGVFTRAEFNRWSVFYIKWLLLQWLHNWIWVFIPDVKRQAVWFLTVHRYHVIVKYILDILPLLVHI